MGFGNSLNRLLIAYIICDEKFSLKTIHSFPSLSHLVNMLFILDLYESRSQVRDFRFFFLCPLLCYHQGIQDFICAFSFLAIIYHDAMFLTIWVRLF